MHIKSELNFVINHFKGVVEKTFTATAHIVYILPGIYHFERVREKYRHNICNYEKEDGFLLDFLFDLRHPEISIKNPMKYI